MELYQTKQAVDSSSQEKGQTYQLKNSLDQKEVDPILQRSGLWFPREREATGIRQRTSILTALSSKSVALATSRRQMEFTFETSLAQQNETDPDKNCTKWTSSVTQNQWHHWKAKTKKQTEEPQIGDVALIQQRYNQLMALPVITQEKGASDAVFDQQKLFDH